MELSIEPVPYTELFYVRLDMPVATSFPAGVVDGRFTVPIPSEFRLKPYRWIRLRNHWNWRVGTVYTGTTPFSLVNFSVDIEGATKPISDLSGATPILNYTSWTAINAITANRGEDPSWRPISDCERLLPPQMNLYLKQLPFGAGIVFDTISFLEFELSDAYYPPKDR